MNPPHPATPRCHCHPGREASGCTECGPCRLGPNCGSDGLSLEPVDKSPPACALLLPSGGTTPTLLTESWVLQPTPLGDQCRKRRNFKHCILLFCQNRALNKSLLIYQYQYSFPTGPFNPLKREQKFQLEGGPSQETVSALLALHSPTWLQDRARSSGDGHPGPSPASSLRWGDRGTGGGHSSGSWEWQCISWRPAGTAPSPR